MIRKSAVQPDVRLEATLNIVRNELRLSTTSLMLKVRVYVI